MWLSLAGGLGMTFLSYFFSSVTDFLQSACIILIMKKKNRYIMRNKVKFKEEKHLENIYVK